LSGCDLSVEEAATAGVYDFVAGTVTEILMALLPLGSAVAGATGT
jgi:hypothetical protein